MAEPTGSAASGRLVLRGGHVVLLEGVVHDGTVVVNGSRIEGVFLPPEFSPKPDDRIIDCADRFVCPGFIDLHNQGGGGFTVMSGDPGDIAGMCRFHAGHGTTGLLLTPVVERYAYRALLPELAAQAGKDTGGAAVLGIHAEGPFVNPARAGFMPLTGIADPDPAIADELLDLCGDALAEVTIAPELPGALGLVQRFARADVIVSLGHSDADLATTLRAIDHGASHVTHLYNAMRPFHHREPGLIGAALYSPELTVEVIPDGFHVHPWVLGFTVQNKGVHRTCLITDAMSPAGLQDGEHTTMGQHVRLLDGRLSAADNHDVLAGSVLTMDRAVAAMINSVGIGISEAVAMASATPAAVLGLDHRKGRLAPGFDADIAILDRTWRTVATIVGGTVLYDGR